MPELHCYKHIRADGGVRYGVSVDYQAVLYRFEAGTTDDGPGLDWYVDIRCLGKSLPIAPAAVREWLRTNANSIKAGLRDAAASITQGVPAGHWPFLFDLADAPTGTFISMMISAVRRYSNAEIAAELMRFYDEWNDVVDTITVFEADAVEV